MNEKKIIAHRFPDENGPLGLIQLNRPNALNALDQEMILDLSQIFKTYETDSTIKAIIIYGEGERAFCAGGDIRKVYEAGVNNRNSVLPFFYHEYQLDYAISQCKKPFLAFIHGVTMGGGIGISLHTRYRIASNTGIRLAMPETAIGFFPDVGGSYLLQQLPYPLGLYLALTGNEIALEDALHYQLVDYALDFNGLKMLWSELAEVDSTEYENILKKWHTLAKTPSKLAASFPLIEKHFSLNSIKDIFQSLTKASSEEWASFTLNNLYKRSPMSLLVTFEQFKRTRNATLAECFQMDYCLVHHFLKGPDFYEGIKALLIDKNRQPQWQPDTIEKITPIDVANYFERQHIN